MYLGQPLQIHDAARRGDIQVIKQMLATPAGHQTDMLDQANPEGLTALHIASSREHIELMELLLSSGANVDAKSRTGDTALNLAAHNGWVKVAECLLRFRPNLELENN